MWTTHWLNFLILQRHAKVLSVTTPSYLLCTEVNLLLDMWNQHHMNDTRSISHIVMAYIFTHGWRLPCILYPHPRCILCGGIFWCYTSIQFYNLFPLTIISGSCWGSIKEIPLFTCINSPVWAVVLLSSRIRGPISLTLVRMTPGTTFFSECVCLCPIFHLCISKFGPNCHGQWSWHLGYTLR